MEEIDFTNSVFFCSCVKFVYQFHLIVRIDDTTQVQIENLQKHDYFDSCFETGLNWSKNVTDERDAPW